MDKKNETAMIEEMAGKLKQVAPYVVEFNEKFEDADVGRLARLAERMGSNFRHAKGPYMTRKGKFRFQLSDPLCQMLEAAGMNK